MPQNNWVGTLINSQVDSTALTNTVTATTIIPAAARVTLPNNYFDVIGKSLRIRASGRISTVVTTPGTLTFSVRIGTGPVIAATSDALTLNIVAKTNAAWFLDWTLVCRAIGASTSANLMHMGTFMSEAVIGAPVTTVGGIGVLPLVAATPVVGTGFDSTSAQVVDLFGTWSVANASNSILTHMYWLTADN